MPDTKPLLERAARSAPGTDQDLDGVRARLVRRRRAGRARAAVVALALTVLSGAAVFSLPRGPAGDAVASGPTGDGEALPPATTPPLVADDGEYHYRAVLLVSACGDDCGVNDVALDATTWWSPSEDSGRIVVDAAEAYGIEAGRFGPGAFPNTNGIDVTDFPLDPDALLRFLLARSGPDGASPAPVVTPPPGGAPFDGQLWRAITDLLVDPHVTPAVRAALLDAAARLQGSSVTVDDVDPFGRPAHVIRFGDEGGTMIERLYVDPGSHDLLTWTSTAAGQPAPGRYYVVQDAGIASSIETAIEPGQGSVPSTLLSVDDLRALGAGGSSEPQGPTVERAANVTARCSQGGPDLTLTRSDAGYDRECFVVEAGAPFTITFTITTHADGGLRIVDAATGEVVLDGERITGPGEIRYEVQALDYLPGEANEYLVSDGDSLVGTLYAR